MSGSSVLKMFRYAAETECKHEAYMFNHLAPVALSKDGARNGRSMSVSWTMRICKQQPLIQKDLRATSTRTHACWQCCCALTVCGCLLLYISHMVHTCDHVSSIPMGADLWILMPCIFETHGATVARCIQIVSFVFVCWSSLLRCCWSLYCVTQGTSIRILMTIEASVIKLLCWYGGKSGIDMCSMSCITKKLWALRLWQIMFCRTSWDGSIMVQHYCWNIGSLCGILEVSKRTVTLFRRLLNAWRRH